MKDCGIYSITNKVNGKFYIGSSIHLKHRWIEHRSDLNRGRHGNPYLQKSWNKYGEENFTYKILEYVNESELFDREQWYLDNSGCLVEENGYNIISRADRSVSGKDSPVAKIVFQYAKDGTFIKEWETVTGAARGLSLSYDAIGQCARGINRSSGGFQWSFSKYKKIQPYVEKRNYYSKKNHKSKRVYQYDISGSLMTSWECVSDAARILDISPHAIMQCARKNYKERVLQNSSCGYVWTYIKKNSIIYQKPINPNSKIIYQYNDSVLVKVWPNISAASKYYGVTKSAITRCLDSCIKKSCGFVWKSQEVECLAK